MVTADDHDDDDDETAANHSHRHSLVTARKKLRSLSKFLIADGVDPNRYLKGSAGVRSGY